MTSAPGVRRHREHHALGGHDRRLARQAAVQHRRPHGSRRHGPGHRPGAYAAGRRLRLRAGDGHAGAATCSRWGWRRPMPWRRASAGRCGRRAAWEGRPCGGRRVMSRRDALRCIETIAGMRSALEEAQSRGALVGSRPDHGGSPRGASVSHPAGARRERRGRGVDLREPHAVRCRRRPGDRIPATSRAICSWREAGRRRPRLQPRPCARCTRRGSPRGWRWRGSPMGCAELRGPATSGASARSWPSSSTSAGPTERISGRRTPSSWL